MFSPVHAELARGTTEILPMYFNGASSKSIVYHYLIGLDGEGNTREVFHKQQINKFCLFFFYFSETMSIFSIKSITSLSEYSQGFPLDQSADK